MLQAISKANPSNRYMYVMDTRPKVPTSGAADKSLLLNIRVQGYNVILKNLEPSSSLIMNKNVVKIRLGLSVQVF